jgi:hypothetical protein
VQILANRELAGRLGEAGRTAAARFTFERMMTGYEGVYDRLIAFSSAGRKSYVEAPD